jgi:hypothetical protein
MKLSKLVEASQKREAFNKYNAVELMGQLMGLLKKYQLDDAAQAFKKVTPIINKAWQGRDKDAAVRHAQTDWNEYNTKLAKLMAKLKKEAGAKSIKQNYKGTGKQKARRQLWVRFKSGAVIDIWIDMGYVGLGGVVTNRPPGSDVLLSKKRIPYDNNTPEQTYAEVLKVLKPWANPS